MAEQVHAEENEVKDQVVGGQDVLSPQEDVVRPKPPAAVVKSVQLQEISQEVVSSKANSIDLLMDVSLEVTIELGRTTMSVKEILSLGVGSIIELDRMSGDPVDILVNGKLIAKGEVVVIEDNLGVRITSIVSPSERASGL